MIASVQPAHAVADRRMCEARLDRRTLEGSYAWRSLLRAGARLALGSDAPVAGVDPRLTFTCAVDRGEWRKEECLRRDEAMRGMTVDAAYAAFMEKQRGMVAPGLQADLAVLSHDWIETGNAMKSQVLLTVAAGEVVHAAAEFS